uniref:ArsA family ATPase n=1 Tax=Streptomyces albidus (ex Kaewkla and Franco 2022) TaxID=722709 RepID=UPI0015EE73D1
EVPATGGQLWFARIDSGEHFRGSATALQERSRTVLDLLGAEPLDEDELTQLPGADAFALLRTLYAAHTAGEWDTLVVDLPHTPEALHLLALPAQLRRYLRRLLPPERQAARALRPALAQLAGVPMPTAALYGTAARWEAELASVQGVLESPDTAVRIVAEPGPLAAEALRQARAGLGLYGLSLGAVVANRVLPTGSSDPWLTSASGRQQKALAALRAECEAEDVPLRELPHLGRDPGGVDDLDGLASAVGAQGPAATARRGVPVRSPGSVEDRLAEDGLLVWRMPLPSVRKDELGLVRRGDELIIGVGPYRRAVPLPSALRRCRVVGAALERGELRVRCAPDPALWPEGTQS